MRGPLLSGPLGSTATLTWVADVLRPRGPVVILSALWLAETLAVAGPVLALIEPDKRSAARRTRARAVRAGLPLVVAVAAEELPLAAGSVGAVVIESLSEIEDDALALAFLNPLVPAVRPGGVVLALEATKSPAIEERLSGLFLGAGLVSIVQERPREGVVATVGQPPPLLVQRALERRAAE